MKFQLVKYILAMLASLTLLSCGGSSSNSEEPGTGPGNPPPPTSPPPSVDTSATDLAAQLQGQAFDQILDIAVPAMALRNPEQVLSSGLKDYYGLEVVSLTDISFDYQNITLDMVEVILNALAVLDKSSLSVEQQLSFDIYKWQLERQLEQRDFLHFDYQGTYFITGVVNYLQRFFIDLHPLQTAQDAIDYNTRLTLVDDKIDQLIENIRDAESLGVIEPAITLQVAINVHTSTRNKLLDENPYVMGFVNRYENATNSEIEQVRNIVNNQINPAYQRLINALSEQLPRAPADVGVGQFERGNEYYLRQLKYHTTTDMTPDEIHQLGLTELDRIHAELAERFAALGYPEGESLQESLARVAEDGGTVLAADAVTTYEMLIEQAISNMQPLFSRFPQQSVTVIGGDSGGFYIRGSFDGTRAGAFYAATTYDQPYYQMPSLAYHEAMPGHHMQIALMQELDVPDFRKSATFTGFVEGWALYAERLAGEYGWYQDDVYGDIGRLVFEALRAARLVVDTGIHARGWSFDRATQFFQDNVGSSLSSAQGNIARYSIYTGQATAYMVGMLKILELRERMQQAMGEDFDIKAFHSLMLENGSLPLAILEQLVDRAIADYQAAG